jgi:hypothetical protein
MRSWFLRCHRWTALIFSLPLIFVLGTGLILAFEPWAVVEAIDPGSLTSDRIQSLLDEHDAGGKARDIAYRSYDKTLTIGAGRGGPRIVVDVITGQALSGPSNLANLFITARRMHETLLIDSGWLVVSSTLAMLALAILGILMGLPRLNNTLSGWHKGMAWALLPLVVLSPLTGLFLASGITFTSPRRSTNPRKRPR